MRGRDIGGFVAPDCPRSERQLNEKKCDPQHPQSLERGNLTRTCPKARRKRNDCGCNQQREKPVCHLRPDLERSHVGKPLPIATGIDVCQRSRAGVGNPRTICGGKIENRQVAMLVAHRRAERKLYINSKRYCNGQCCDRREFRRPILKRETKTCCSQT